ncbi:hypothetical protein [Campylobacter sp. US33a]|uniref:hypothetical protein n=1 Tax=Campylobacter sp. US33a TaxID=2498120 RepID=UPI001068AA26|nr:hypothetical protein [Campylobacter sp. US33a]TEY01260.1 hypothetical protein ELQ16_07830 [Campylobacter sp. US33a]
MRELSLVALKFLNSVFNAKTAHFNGFLELDFKNKSKLKKQRFKRKKKMSSKQKIRFKKRKI